MIVGLYVLGFHSSPTLPSLPSPAPISLGCSLDAEAILLRFEASCQSTRKYLCYGHFHYQLTKQVRVCKSSCYFPWSPRCSLKKSLSIHQQLVSISANKFPRYAELLLVSEVVTKSRNKSMNVFLFLSPMGLSTVVHNTPFEKYRASSTRYFDSELAWVLSIITFALLFGARHHLSLVRGEVVSSNEHHIIALTFVCVELAHLVLFYS